MYKEEVAVSLEMKPPAPTGGMDVRLDTQYVEPRKHLTVAVKTITSPHHSAGFSTRTLGPTSNKFQVRKRAAYLLALNRDHARIEQITDLSWKDSNIPSYGTSTGFQSNVDNVVVPGTSSDPHRAE
jgi:hypothetical protein